MGENWLSIILRDQLEAEIDRNAEHWEITPGDAKDILEKMLNAAAFKSDDVWNHVKDRMAAIPSAPEPQLPTVSAKDALRQMLRKFADETGLDWAQEAFDNFQNGNRAEDRKGVPPMPGLKQVEILIQQVLDGNTTYRPGVKNGLENVAISIREGRFGSDYGHEIVTPSTKKALSYSTVQADIEALLASDGRWKAGTKEKLEDAQAALNGTLEKHPAPVLPNPQYNVLRDVLDDAYRLAESKGRALCVDGRGFEQQPIIRVSEMAGDGFAIGQVIRKADESRGLPDDKAYPELLGVIVYAAAAAWMRIRETGPDGLAPNDDDEDF